MIDNKIKSIMGQCFEVDSKAILDSSSQKTLVAWDSLAHMNLTIALEMEFNIELEPEEIAAMTSFAMVKKIINNKLGG